MFATPKNFLNAADGDNSAKRFWGCRLLRVGTVLAIIKFILILILNVLDISLNEQTNKTTHDILVILFTTGAGLLLGGVAERWGK